MIDVPLARLPPEAVAQARRHYSGKDSAKMKSCDDKVIKKLPQTKMNFMVGLSGESVHVQVIGAKNILAKDDNGTSDPYMLALFQGKKLGITRIKPRTVNPRWKNETFIVPMADNLPDSRGMRAKNKRLRALDTRGA